MYKKILVTLDGSEYAECIVKHVKPVATGSSAPKVILLRVTEPIQPAYPMVEVQQRDAEKRIKAEATEYLSQVAARLKQEGITAETTVVQGQAAEEILNYGENNQVDLIIMGTRGRSGISRWIFGSVAYHVVCHSKSPVLVVPPDAR